MEVEEKPSGREKPKFKLKDLKVYNSTEWLADNKKKYRQVFDRFETTYIYFELTFYNKAFDLENWETDLLCQCIEVSNNHKQICELNFNKKISKYDPIIYIREGWGNKKEGSFWKQGTYCWNIYMGGELIASKYFYIIDSGHKKFDISSYVHLRHLQLYEGQHDETQNTNRTYFSTFSTEQTRYIYTELIFDNNFRRKDWNCEVFVKYYSPSGDLKTVISKTQFVNATDGVITMNFGFGSNTKGTWLPGKYRIEVSFLDELLSISYFKIGDDFVEGFPQIQLPATQESSNLPLPLELDNQTFEEVMEAMDNMIGLTVIKDKIREHAQYIKFLQLRRDHGFKDLEQINMYAVFMGNPGTGKTTIAKMLGKLYNKLGLLSRGHVLEVDRGDLIGEYIGQTAPKVKEVIEKARGGVLFIDEAYSLARSSEDSKDFGREAIEILVKEMSNPNSDLAIVVAGYPKEMKTFLDSNPGLRSRFKHYFNFDDYLPQELSAIATYACQQKEVILDAQAKVKLDEMIVEAYRKRDVGFGNARYVFDLIEKAKINLGLRIMSTVFEKKIKPQQLKTILLKDIVAIEKENLKILPNIPIDQRLLQQSLAELDQLIGIADIKLQIHELVKIVQFYKLQNKNVLAQFNLHCVLVGNPGTGKTTVARILAKIYKALGILEKGNLVETDRQGLVAGFIGQTAIKTSEKIDEAMGGVLFIDEAYALSNFNGLQGDYGNEAIQTILKRMEDSRGMFYVFVAGYPDNMQTFLKSNPGLSSRFDKTLNFPDYSANELFEISLQMFKEKGYKLNNKASEMLQNLCQSLYQTKNKYFGNARTVRKMIIEIINKQNVRKANETYVLQDHKKSFQIVPEDMVDLPLFKEDAAFNKKSIGYGG